MEGEVHEIFERIMKLEATIRRSTEKDSISEVFWRYTRGLDRHDLELIRSAFWPDAQINYGPCSFVRDEWIGAWDANYHKGLTSEAHHLTNQMMDIEGDVAHVESYLIALRRSPDEKTGIVGGGRYIDRLDRRDGDWRISVREFTPHFWIEARSVLFETWTQAFMEVGTEDRGDPSYRRPLLPRAGSREAK